MKVQKELRKIADKEKAKILARFFKTGKGDYGEGDKFLGVVVPEQRRIAKEVLRSWTSDSLEVQLRKTDKTVRSQASGSEILRSRFSRSQMRLRKIWVDLQKLLQSSYHEDRLTALLILIELYKKVDPKIQKQIFNFYLKNIAHINNWDLVDLSAPNIVGDFLLNNFSQLEAKGFLLNLVANKNLWSRRVAILSTWPFIKQGNFFFINLVTRELLFVQKEKHDLLHKALGWMWREVGKKDLASLRKFLDQQAACLPRVMLRYAIERLSPKERQSYLAMVNQACGTGLPVPRLIK